MSTLRWGIVGAGRIAHSFACDIAQVDNGELVAVAARDGERAAGFAAQYGIPAAHAGYQALFDDPSVDAVYIATPHSAHLENCTDAMAHGKAVLCEKPLVLNPDECQTLLAAHKRSGAYLMEGIWTWFLPAIRRAKQWYDEGRIGELRHIRADFGYPIEYSERQREYDARVGGGAVLEMGIYPVAIARLFAGRSPDGVQVIGRRAPNGVEDDVVALCDYGDCMATLGTSFRCKLQNWACIVGTEGYIAIPDFWRAQRCQLYRLDQCIDRFEDSRTSNGFDYQIRAVGDDVQAGRTESTVVPLATSLALQQDMSAIRSAVPEGQGEQRISEDIT